MEHSGQSASLPLAQEKVTLIPEFTVRDADKFNEIAAAVQGRTTEAINIQNEHFMKICPKTLEQEKVIRDTLAGMQIDYDRSWIQVGHFIINGLLPDTRAVAVVAELQALGVTTKYVTQLRNGNFLLPLFIFKAPRSQAQALSQVRRLCNRDVQVQSYTAENAPFQKQAKMIGHQANANGQRQLGWKNPCPKKWGCAQLQAPRHAGQSCNHGMQNYRCGNAPFMCRKMSGYQAPNCCRGSGWKRPVGQHCNHGMQNWNYRAPSMQGNMFGPRAANCCVGWKQPRPKMFAKWGCAGQHCNHGVQMQNYRAPFMQGKMCGQRAANCCPNRQGQFGWKGPRVQNCSNFAPKHTCQQGPGRRNAGPNAADLQTLSVLQELKKEVEKLKVLPQQMTSLFK